MIESVCCECAFCIVTPDTDIGSQEGDPGDIYCSQDSYNFMTMDGCYNYQEREDYDED